MIAAAGLPVTATSPLEDYAFALRASWRWLCWGVVGALFITATALLITPPLHRCDATVFVRTPGDVSSVLDGGDSYAQGRARTYAALANNTALTARVVADLGLQLSPESLAERIEAVNPPGTVLIAVSVSSPSPTESQRTATVLLDEFAAMVEDLEAVPGSIVPRAQLVVVDPPSSSVEIRAWGLPVAAVRAGAALLGLGGAALLVALVSIRGSRR